MAKLTDVRDTPEIANGAKVIAVPVKGGTTIYQGALVALDASGYAIPGKKAESLTAVGRAEETVTNTGADGELVIRVARGVFVFDNTATAANKITAAHVLKPCYMEDDHTVTALATGASVAGTVIRVDDEGVAVECGGYIPAAAAADPDRGGVADALPRGSRRRHGRIPRRGAAARPGESAAGAGPDAGTDPRTRIFL